MGNAVQRFGSPELRDDRPILGLVVTTFQALSYPAQIISTVNMYLGRHNAPHILVEMINFGKFEDLMMSLNLPETVNTRQIRKDITYMVGSAACRLEDAGARAIAICPQLAADITCQFKLSTAKIIPAAKDGAIVGHAYVPYLASWYCRQVQKDPS